jgi:hypothetical protein
MSHAHKIIHEELSAVLSERGQSLPDVIEGTFLSVMDSLAFVDLMLRIERRTGVMYDVSEVDLADLAKVDCLTQLLALSLDKQHCSEAGTDA